MQQRARVQTIRQAADRFVRRHVVVLALFAGAAVVMTWPLALNLRDTLPSWGDPVEHAWVIAWDIRAFTRDPLDIFNANVLFPYRNTLAYSDHLIGQALVVTPLYWLSTNAVLTENVTLLLAYSLCGFMMYLLVYDLTGSRAAGIVAGLTYAYAPSRMAHFEHTNLLSAQWMPLGVLATFRALRQGSWRWAVLAGLALFLQGLFALYYFLFMCLLLGVVLSVWLGWKRDRVAVRRAAQVGIACAGAVVLLVPTLLPYQEVSDDLGIERLPDEIMYYRARPDDYLAVHPGNRLYGEVLGARFHENIERDLFPGVALVGLALLGLANRRVGWERWILLVVIGFGVVLSAGLYVVVSGHEVPMPYRLFYELMPGFKAVRVPARFGGLFTLVGLSALAGCGTDVLLRRVRVWSVGRRMPLPATPVVAATLAVLVCAEGAMAWRLPPPLPTSLEAARRPDYSWMAAHPAVAIELPMGVGPVASAWPNFWSTLHWNEVVNGYGAVIPPAYFPLRMEMRAFPDPRTIHLLQGIGVETVVYHSEPAIPAQETALLRRVEDYPVLTQVVGKPNYVFQLAPNPWMWELVDALPDGAAVDLPALPEDPVLFGLLAAVLQREGHTVYGEGVLEYWHVPDAPDSVCYVVLPAAEDAGSWGYSGAVLLRESGGLALSVKAGCQTSK